MSYAFSNLTVLLAIISSSFVGIMNKSILDASVEIFLTTPRQSFKSRSILIPNQASFSATTFLTSDEFSPPPAVNTIESKPPIVEAKSRGLP